MLDSCSLDAMKAILRGSGEFFKLFEAKIVVTIYRDQRLGLGFFWGGLENPEKKSAPYHPCMVYFTYIKTILYHLIFQGLLLLNFGGFSSIFVHFCH